MSKSLSLSSDVVKAKKGRVFIWRHLLRKHSLKALRHGSHSFTCKIHYACLSFVSVHQMALPLTEVADVQLQLTTHLSTPKGWKAELDRLVYPHKWSLVRYRSSAGPGKFAGQRPTFYRCATQPPAVRPRTRVGSQVHLWTWTRVDELYYVSGR